MQDFIQGMLYQIRQGAHEVDRARVRLAEGSLVAFTSVDFRPGHVTFFVQAPNGMGWQVVDADRAERGELVYTFERLPQTLTMKQGHDDLQPHEVQTGMILCHFQNGEAIDRVWVSSVGARDFKAVSLDQRPGYVAEFGRVDGGWALLEAGNGDGRTFSRRAPDFRFQWVEIVAGRPPEITLLTR